MLNDAKILAAIGFDDDHITLRNDETGVVKKIEDSNARAFEGDDVKHLAWTTGGEWHAGSAVGVESPLVRLKSNVRDLVAFWESEGLARVGCVGGGIRFVAVHAMHIGVVVADV